MDDDARVSEIAVVAMAAEVAAPHVQLDVALEQAARRRDQSVAEVRACAGPWAPAVDNAQAVAVSGHERLRRERLVTP